MQEFVPSILFNDGDRLADYGINVDNKNLIAGDALMNMFYPTVSMLFHNKNDMLESAGKISRIGDRTIYFGHLMVIHIPTQKKQYNVGGILMYNQ